jgi:hypothetical protein
MWQYRHCPREPDENSRTCKLNHTTGPSAPGRVPVGPLPPASVSTSARHHPASRASSPGSRPSCGSTRPRLAPCCTSSPTVAMTGQRPTETVVGSSSTGSSRHNALSSCWTGYGSTSRALDRPLDRCRSEEWPHRCDGGAIGLTRPNQTVWSEPLPQLACLDPMPLR